MTSKRYICSIAAAIAIITSSISLHKDLRISERGLQLIGNAESCRLNSYKCPAGIKTNGVGNTKNVSDHVISLEKVAQDWASNIKDAEQCITNAEQQSNLKMSQGEFDAFTSFAFNVGCSKFMQNKNGTHTKIYKYITAGKFANACKELPRWIYVGNKKSSGLEKRRWNEYVLCTEN